jgi:L-asparaginase
VNSKKMKIAVLGTGGTIAGAANTKTDNTAYTAAQMLVDDLIAGVPAPPGYVAVCEQLAQVDSKNMDFDLWRALALRCEQLLHQHDVVGVVITHGTDTIEETAYFLHRVLMCSNKPVALTCAMRPATSLSADGPQNLSDAMNVVTTPGARGVVVVCGGAIHGALDVIKMHTSHLEAFSSGDAGPIGYVEGNETVLLRSWPRVSVGADEAMRRWTSAPQWPRVEIVVNHAGNDGRLVKALIQDGVAGIVVAGTGNGTVNSKLEQSLLYAVEGGLKVVRASRCPLGRVIARPDDVLPSAGPLTPPKARIDLMLASL